MVPFTFDTVGEWVFICCLAFLVIQLYYLLFVFSKLAFHPADKSQPFNEPVSVIICARNELNNLKAHLESVLSQKYANFQVIVVNDCSWDESENYLEEMQELHSNLKIVTINEQEKYRHGKKFALSLGIKAATHETLLLTDADCKPVSENWISHMVSGYHAGTEIVIGYGAYRKQPGLLNKWIRMDTVFNAVQFLSAAISGNPYMGVGRNLSYRKSLFFRVKGFASHNHIMSGDDDLFVNQTATSKNTGVVLHKSSFTESVARDTFKGWLLQKKRHMSTGIHYKLSNKFRITLYFLSHFLFFVTLFTAIFTGCPAHWILIAFGLRMLVQLFIFGRCMKKLNEFDVLWLMPLFDFLITLIYPALSLSNVLIKEKKWR